MKTILGIATLALMMTTSAYAVSVGELIGKCGDDSKIYCKDVGYGDAMQECLDGAYAKLTPECKLVMDRLRDGERVSLF